MTNRKPILTIIVGIAIGAALFILGELDDAPGLCGIGVTVAFLLTLRGLRHLGIIDQRLILPIIFFCFGAAAALASIVLLLDGEFGTKPWIAIIGVVLAMALISIGAVILKQRKQNTKS